MDHTYSLFEHACSCRVSTCRALVGLSYAYSLHGSLRLNAMSSLLPQEWFLPHLDYYFFFPWSVVLYPLSICEMTFLISLDRPGRARFLRYYPADWNLVRFFAAYRK